MHLRSVSRNNQARFPALGCSRLRNCSRLRAIPSPFPVIWPGQEAIRILPGPGTPRRSTLADPAEGRIRLGRGCQVLAVAPGATRAFVVPALTAGGADHDPILSPDRTARQSRLRCVPMRVWGTSCLGARISGVYLDLSGLRTREGASPRQGRPAVRGSARHEKAVRGNRAGSGPASVP